MLEKIWKTSALSVDFILNNFASFCSLKCESPFISSQAIKILFRTLSCSRQCVFKLLIFSLGIGGAIAGCVPDKKVGLGNPASKNCLEKGGNIIISKRGDGSEYGVCVFVDNRQCEEWAMFRGECREGGLKITGYLTPEGIYCAILGGKVLENETQCQLPSGKICTTQDLYNGRCP